MPRNSSGTYTLPAGNPVVTGTTISSTWANTTLSDLSSEMTDSLDRSGKGGMLAPLALSDGTVALPALTFVLDPDTGVYRIGANDVAVSVGGIKSAEFFNNTGVGQSLFADGSVGIPGISFSQDLDTGMYRGASNDLGITVGGVLAMEFFNNAGATQALLVDGLVGKPSLGFSLDTDTGFYRAGSGRMRWVGNGGVLLDIDQVASTATFNIPVLGPDGSIGTPAYSFSSDPDTGWYRFGTNDMRPVAGGVAQAVFNTTGVYILFQDGSLPSPSLTFSSDPDTGIYRSASNDIRVTAGGVFVAGFRLAAATPAFFVADGTAAVPSITFGANVDTGFYRDTTSQIGIALGGVTAGQISQGSFTLTATGCVGTPNDVAIFQRWGQWVHLYIPNIQGTSNSASFTLTGLPAAIQPTKKLFFSIQCTDNSIATGGTMDTGAQLNSGSGTITMFKNGGTATWTGSNTKGIATNSLGGVTLIYLLN